MLCRYVHLYYQPAIQETPLCYSLLCYVSFRFFLLRFPTAFLFLSIHLSTKLMEFKTIIQTIISFKTIKIMNKHKIRYLSFIIIYNIYMQRLKDRIGNIIRLITFLFFSPPTVRIFCVRLCDWCLCVRVI